MFTKKFIKYNSSLLLVTKQRNMIMQQHCCPFAKIPASFELHKTVSDDYFQIQETWFLRSSKRHCGFSAIRLLRQKKHERYAQSSKNSEEDQSFVG